MTKREEIYPSQKAFHEKINIDLLKESTSLGATHVLVGIDWGAMATITCEDQYTEEEDVKSVKSNLGGKLRMLDATVSGVSVKNNVDRIVSGGQKQMQLR